MQVRLPVDQALWTREQVEAWLAKQKLSDMVSLQAAEQFAVEAGWQRPGTPPIPVKIPSAMLPVMGILTDPASWRTEVASVYLDQQSATAYATDGKLVMRTRVKPTGATKDMTAERIDAVLPARGNRRLVAFDAWNLLRLCLSAVAAGDPGQPRDCRIDLHVGAAENAPVRYEIVSREDNIVQAVGAIMPLNVDKAPNDPAGIA